MPAAFVALTGITAIAQADLQTGAAAIQSATAGSYSVRNLVSDGFVKADHIDPDLVNPWGVAFNPQGFVWVADNETGVSTLYNGAGVKQSLVVTIPPAPGGMPPGSPTGIVFSGGSDFVVTQGTASGPSRFLFATEQGTIAAWAPAVDPTNAITVVNRSASHAIYKGIALAGTGSGHFLYATDFHNGRVDMFNDHFRRVTPAGAFVDPDLPAGYGPFGIQNILGDLYVTYAKQDDDKEDDVQGAGFGFVDVYTPGGGLIRRIASRGPLNAPWGLALAPADFGRFANMLLVGNFGDGHISAYDLSSHVFVGQLRGDDDRPLELEGLWGIQFGNGLQGQPTGTLFFAAGPDDEAHGVYGRIDAH